MDQATLNEILKKHELWLKGDPNGKRANLEDADLKDADLEDTDLKYANLKCANLEGANLEYANLKCANLEGVALIRTISQNMEGQKVISVQVDTSRVNNAISYWKDLGLWTTGCFQGTLEELQEKVAEAHKDNTFLRERYERVIKFILSEAEQDEKKPTSGN